MSELPKALLERLVTIKSNWDLSMIVFCSIEGFVLHCTTKFIQVDTHVLKLWLEGHSKCPSVFYHLETGTLMLRHILTKTE